MSLFTDHKVTYRSEAFLAEVAMACRKIGTVPGSNHVNLQTILDELQAHGVESISSIRGMKRKGRLKIEIVEDDPYDFPAFVEFSPQLTLSVQKSVWQRFQEGRSEERVIIAHEIGHIMLHDNEAKQFSRDGSLQIKFAEDEHSAEWQANKIADHLLIPTILAQQIDDAARIAFSCNVPETFASERLLNVRKIKKVLNRPFGGEPCPNCGEFSLMAEDDRQRCDSCSYSRNHPRPRSDGSATLLT
jgi:ribosomal protein S27AE